ncbi:inosine-uridine preferring nucleoside hydrolase [Candidatus Symbiothrix dinenymphae]|nr:inosine-uridine preferring nucleoside hydrolase [Candidatus Symbiothrix dinenymphae]
MKRFWTVLMCAVVMLTVYSCGITGYSRGQSKNTPVSVIFDTDIGPDYGDVGALTILHALADSGELKIVATVACNMFELSVPCIDLTNRYYGRPNIPIGAPLTGPNEPDIFHDTPWTKALVNKYPHQLKSSADAEDAVKVYRRVLAAQPDTSVVIVTTGFFTNLGALLQSKPDQYSPLDGKQLVAKKVKFLSSMAGAFPSGREYNVYVDVPASVIVFEQWPTRIVFSGYEIGFKIPSGDRLVATTNIDSPCHESYLVCSRDRVKKAYLGLSWDQTSVLIAARGVDRYFNSVKGKATIAPDGSNGWQEDPNGKHEYLTWKTSPEELTTLIEDLMMHEAVK